MPNKCGECTLCCELLPVPSIGKKANELCRYCTLGKGCSIYKDRPNECKKFECAYYQMDRVSINLRPDKCKIIFEKLTNHIFFGTQDPRYLMTDIAKKQIVEFGKQGFSTIVSTNGKIKFYLSRKHNERQIKQEFKNYMEKKYGSS